ncbi:MAG TPA: DMT family transporter [Frankiaceae bacterium]|nr:DMT family transporter [Frankiaceae bacterium]
MTAGAPTSSGSPAPAEPPGAPAREGHLSLLAAVAGATLAVQSRINGALRVRVGDAVVAALVSFTVGSLVLVAASLATGRWRAVVRLRHRTRWWWWLGGLSGALLVGSAAAAVPAVGVALTGVAIVAGATTGSLVVDRLGISPRGHQPLTPPRLLGSALAVAGLVVGTVGQGGEVRPLLLALVGFAGFCTALQQAANGHLQRHSGEVLVAASVSFLIGTSALALAVAVTQPAIGEWPANPGLYVGGLGGAAYIALGAFTVARIGVLRLTLGTVAGQLVGGVLLDAFVPTAAGLSAASVAAALFTVAAVVVANR